MLENLPISYSFQNFSNSLPINLNNTTYYSQLFCIIIQLTTDYTAMEWQIMYKIYLIAIKEARLIIDDQIISL